jgi:diguanylate cyclase (GGDEF)-like protein
VQYFESRRLGRSTTLGFLTIVVVIALQSLFGAWKMNELSDELSEALVNFSDTQVEALKLKVVLVTLRKFEKDILLNHSQADELISAHQRWQNELASAKQQLKLMEFELKVSGVEIKASVEELSKALQVYGDGVQSVVLAMQQKKRMKEQDAVDAITAYKTHIYMMENAIDHIVDQAESYEIASITRLNQHKDILIHTLSGVSIIFVLIGIILSISVVRKSMRISRSLEHQTMHDTLTGILNRRGLSVAISQNPTQGGVLVYVDFDRFKLVNDLCGHVVGDELLVNIANKMNDLCTAMNCSLARVGGDEFVVWLEEENGIDRAHQIAQQLVTLVEEHSFEFLGQRLQVGASVGIAKAEAGFVFTEVMSRADAACRIAKFHGHVKVVEYAETDPNLLETRSEERWAAKIPQMVLESKFCLYGQVILPLQGQTEAGHVEILIHGLDETNEIIPPFIFLPAAERFGLMSKIDRWVFETFLTSEFAQNVNYSLNISAHTLADKNYLPKLMKLVKDSGKAQQIIFEITESAAITHIETARSYIRQLKSLGCRFSLDDFGSGFSSFAYLCDLNVDYLKIDGSLIRVLGRNESDTSVVMAIVNMAKALGLKTIAEYVETTDLSILLKNMKVDFGQGYALHKPEPLAQAAVFAQKQLSQ